MRESRTDGSVRGALSNGCPYRVPTNTPRLLQCMSPFLALLGPPETSDLSPQSGPKRTLIRSLLPIAIL